MNSNNSTTMPLGIQPVAGSMAKPLSEEDWVKRLERLKELGVADDSVLMRGTEWRRGLAADREATRDTVRQALGLQAKDSAALGAAAKGAGSSSLLSSL